MRKTALAGTAVLVFALTLTACGAGDDMTSTSMNESSSAPSQPEDAMAMDRTGSFEGHGDKTVTGSVMVSADQIEFADFSSDEGPDLHVYLTNGTDESAVEAGMEIDSIAFDEASQTFMLDGANVDDFDTVVIHCDKAKAVFGAAPLSS